MRNAGMDELQAGKKVAGRNINNLRYAGETTLMGVSEEELKESMRVKEDSEKARKFQKNIYFCCIDYAKAFDCVDHNKLENSSRDGNTTPPYLPPEKSVCRSGSNS